MSAADRFLPRNQSAARWVLFVLTGVAAGVNIVATLVFPPARQLDGIVTVLLCALLIVVVTCLVAMSQPPAWVWAAYPFLAIGLIVVLDLLTRDASVTAQVFFFFPVLYAGAQLRRSAAVVVCVASVTGEAVVAFTLSAGSKAGTDLVFVAAALVTAAALLLHAGERNDRLIAQLERQAAVDPLTGLMTRRVLDTAVRSALDGAGDTGGTALLVMDVDYFKTINDRHGHPAGDAVLQQLATILLELSRPGDLVSRLGGDEIAVLLAGCPQDVAARRAEHLLRSVRSHAFVVPGPSGSSGDVPPPLTVTLSIGVAHVSTRARELRTLYTAADAALYEAKRLGRDRVAIAPPEAAAEFETARDGDAVALRPTG